MNELKGILKYADTSENGWILTFALEDSQDSVEVKLSPKKYDAVAGEAIRDDKKEAQFKKTIDEKFNGDPNECIDKEYTIYETITDEGKVYYNLDEFKPFATFNKGKECLIKVNTLYDGIIKEVSLEDKGLIITATGDKMLLKDGKTPATFGKAIYFRKFNKAKNAFEDRDDRGLKLTFIQRVKDLTGIEIIGKGKGNIEYFELAHQPEEYIGKPIKFIGKQTGANIYVDPIASDYFGDE